VTSPSATPVSHTAPSPGNHAPASRSKSTNETGWRNYSFTNPLSLTRPLEILRREIHDAQQELMNSTSHSIKSNRLAHSEKQPLGPQPSGNRSKTSSAGEKTPSLKKTERRKTLKTYGSSRDQKKEIIDPAFEALRALEQPERKEDNTWDLPASIRDQFLQHEPVSMFPDPSSTIPDNTLTQRRIIEEALSADQLLQQPNPHIPHPSGSSAPSIPWSDYLTQGVSAYLQAVDLN
jgi:hypothetical protein